MRFPVVFFMAAINGRVGLPSIRSSPMFYLGFQHQMYSQNIINNLEGITEVTSEFT